ncbi:MAG: hypothetical protein N2376_08825 [Clostridia bacterium]|nr:hypothetical protein [Clostridia bacterium]
MKNFITGACILVLLLIFPLQNAQDLINQNRINKFSTIVYFSTQTARTDGYFKQTNINKLKADLIAAFPDLSEADIYINVTTTPKYRTDEFDSREAIYYDIRIPVRKILAAPRFFGLSDSENQYISRRSGFVLSEVPMP